MNHPPPSTVVLVTGGAGYIGSHTCLHLLQGGYGVVALDNCCNAVQGKSEGDIPVALQRVQELAGESLTFHKVSTLDGESLREIFRKYPVSVVIHFAALKAVGESVSHPLNYYSNNVCGTITLLQVMSEFDVKRLVLSSSATVYGSPQFLPINETHPTGINITNPYGQTKYMCEEIAKDVTVADKEWKVSLLRYFNPVGAHPSGRIGEDPLGPPNNLMPFLSQVAVGRRDVLKVFGNDYGTPDGTGIRDYIHVEDLAGGHVAALGQLMTSQKEGLRAYNLGTGKGVSVMQMIKAFSQACGHSIPAEVVGRRAGDLAEVVACCRRAKEELNWEATKTLQQMCEDTWRWQENNKMGYK